jgi:hypothetical protein
MQSKHAVIYVTAKPARVKVRRKSLRGRGRTTVWAAAVGSVADAEAIAAGSSRYSLAHGHTLDGKPITRTVSAIAALIEARARTLEVPLLARFNALDDPDGDVF